MRLDYFKPGDCVAFRLARPIPGYVHPLEGQEAEVVRVSGLGADLVWLRFEDGEERPVHRGHLVNATTEARNA